MAPRDRGIYHVLSSQKFEVNKYIICLCAVAGLLSATSPANSQTVNDPKLVVREVTSGLNQPTAMAFVGPGDILVLQKGDGQVRRVVNGTLLSSAVLDVAVDRANERGLLGIAVHPEFPTTPFVYLYYTESSTGADTNGTPTPVANRVYRYTWNGSALASPILILDLPVTPGPNHNGGTMTFGPDGKLYVVIGDLNHTGQLQNFSNGTPDDTGVIFRVNDDGSTPVDNPFFSEGGNLARYYAYGIRNSFGLAFDPLTGELWDTENGPESFDEVNLVMPGFNSGWAQIMGPDSRDPQGVSDLFQFPGSHYADPKFSWFTTVGPTSIMFVNSTRLGLDYKNDVLVGDINNGRIYYLIPNTARDGFEFVSLGLADLVADNSAELQEVVFGTEFGGITDLKIGPDGRLYILSFGFGTIFVVSRIQVATAGVYDPVPGIFFLNNANGAGGADVTFQFGPGGQGWEPLVGDWNGDGVDTVGVYDPSTGVFFLKNTNAAGSADVVFQFGPGGLGWIPLVGDWNGDGVDTVGVYDPLTGTFFLKNANAVGAADVVFQFGPGGQGWEPLVGDWNGDEVDTVGAYNPSTGVFFLRDSNSAGGANVTFQFGPGEQGWVPLTGNWVER